MENMKEALHEGLGELYSLWEEIGERHWKIWVKIYCYLYIFQALTTKLRKNEK